MYADDNFLRFRELLEKRIVVQAQAEVERKHLIDEMDNVLGDLDRWKN